MRRELEACRRECGLLQVASGEARGMQAQLLKESGSWQARAEAAEAAAAAQRDEQATNKQQQQQQRAAAAAQRAEMRRQVEALQREASAEAQAGRQTALKLSRSPRPLRLYCAPAPRLPRRRYLRRQTPRPTYYPLSPTRLPFASPVHHRRHSSGCAPSTTASGKGIVRGRSGCRTSA